MYDFNFQPVFASWDALLVGALLTIRLSATAMVFGLGISILGAVARTSHVRPLRMVVASYVEVIRNTPFIVQIYFIFFGLPAAGITLSPNTAALMALTINVGAYGTEIVRSGIEAIPRGQIEAGRALALSPFNIFRHVVIKPALRTIYPSLTSQFIYLMLMSSVVSVISASDLASVGADINAATFASFEVYLVLTAAYLAMALGFSGLFALIRRKLFTYPVS